MNRHLVAVFLLIVLVPLAIVGWLGMRLAREQHERAGARLEEVMHDNLRRLDVSIGALLDKRERDVRLGIDGSPLTAEALRAQTRQTPIVSQYFNTDTDGELTHPSLMGQLSANEEEFLRRTRDIWAGRQLVPQNRQESDGLSEPISSGWHPWFWGDGLRLIYWWRDRSGQIVGAELDRMRLLSDVVASLPETDPQAPSLATSRIRLVDATGGVLYQWGVYEPTDGEWPLVSHALNQPLAAWSLQYFAADTSENGWRQTLFGLLPGIGGLAVVVFGLAFYFFRESSREMCEAAQRVSFVNQVSHELKTPLTNIRMYAELLEDELSNDDGSRQYLGVIVSESQRLSRLITNILTFSRGERRELKLRRRTGVVDDAVQALLEQFRPSLENHGVTAGFEPGAGRPVSFDVDAVQQIVANLLTNVEKYAASGRRVDVTSEQVGDEVTITVSDRGPGIPIREHERIFEPFYRPSNALTDGVTGTGIGLAIARDLAVLHGGSLELVPAQGVARGSGARFRLTLHCPMAKPTEAEGES